MTNNNIYKQSLVSFNLLSVIHGNVRLGPNNEIIVDEMIITDDDNYKLLLFNNDSKKFRRKMKGEYKYINFFNDCRLIVDYFLLNYTEFENINIKYSKEQIILSLNTIKNNKNVYEVKYEIIDSNLTLDYYITTYIKEYIDFYR